MRREMARSLSSLQSIAFPVAITLPRGDEGRPEIDGDTIWDKASPGAIPLLSPPVLMTSAEMVML